MRADCFGFLPRATPGKRIRLAGFSVFFRFLLPEGSP
ncbi:hypothetical protein BURPS406E_H0816 [Burkholderia pseudomallei 406e]|nr:hypothetical protein BPC006_I2207 [Burkholderia pseudomallei BPC006]EDO84548.1 hypothetical protein BURPS406E_H0816 [Burkholderia pseudomallei 406e]EDO92347.1 hypothetical protein BURPSPAST_AA0847 [Burkholderia pseudomallei Pasteur 52237]EDS86828.1 hypothetical protein BURPSS13_P0782 [Burkholderia pseudomallei S13]EDU07199.1 hypothetical protein BURPS1655_A1607 [Burkholderia pseudomallei 1655]KGR93231.1 hypothetical protein X948_5636 [Burkholderia pseudomallei MSHR5608]KGS16658.1 hypotheti